MAIQISGLNSYELLKRFVPCLPTELDDFRHRMCKCIAASKQESL